MTLPDEVRDAYVNGKDEVLLAYLAESMRRVEELEAAIREARNFIPRGFFHARGILTKALGDE